MKRMTLFFVLLLSIVWFGVKFSGPTLNSPMTAKELAAPDLPLPAPVSEVHAEEADEFGMQAEENLDNP